MAEGAGGAIDTLKPIENREAAVEQEKSPKQRLRELLRPSEELAEKIKSRVEHAARSLIETDPHPEIKKAVEITAGIYLWEQMVGDFDGSLPVGLVYDKSEDLRRVAFDRNILHRSEYEYVMNLLKKQGLTQEISSLQKENRKRHQSEIVETTEQFISQSVPLNEFFASFGIKSKKELTPQAPNAHEHLNLQVQYDEKFKQKYRELPDNRTNPLISSYRREVQAPLQMATINKVSQSTELGLVGETSRARFRNYIFDNFIPTTFRGSFNVEDSRQRFTTKDGEFVLRYEVQDKTGVREAFEPLHPGDWSRFALYSIDGLNETPYFLDANYPALVLEDIGPLLYDSTDTRDYQAIIDSGIKKRASQLAHSFVDEDYQSLTEREWTYETWHQGDRVAWLTDAIGPVSEEDQIESTQTVSWTEQKRGLQMTAKRAEEDKQNEFLGTVNFKDQSLTQDKLILTQKKDSNLPPAPDGQIDLVLQFNLTSPHLLDVYDATLDKVVKGDPEVVGMKLVARNDESHQYFFQRDPEYTLDKPVTNKIPYIAKLQVAEYCQKIGMHPLAEMLRSHDQINLSQMVGLLKDNMQFYFPEEDTYFPDPFDTRFTVKGDEGWIVDDQGKLLGNSYVFNAFLMSVVDFIYPDATKSMQLFYGPLLVGNHIQHDTYQTRLKVPGEKIDCLLSISPPLPDLRKIREPEAISTNPVVTDDSQDMQVKDAYGREGEGLASEVAMKNKILRKPNQTQETTTEENVLGREKFVESASQTRVSGEGERLKISTTSEIEKKRENKIAEILFSEKEVWSVPQRLMQPRPRDTSLPTSFDYAQTDLLMSFTEGKLLNEESDPFIFGMKLVARDGNTCYFQLDKESKIYDPVSKPVPDEKRLAIVTLCQEMGMSDLAKDLQLQDGLSIDELRTLVRKYVKPWIPKEGGKKFVVKTSKDFADNGLIDEDGNLRGQCDTFEFFMRDLLHTVDPEAEIMYEYGWSLRNDQFIDTQLHAQTRYKSNEIDALIDVEPDPKKGEIEAEWESKRIPLTKKEMTEKALESMAQELSPPRPVLVDSDSKELSIPKPPPIDKARKVALEKEMKEKRFTAAVDLFELQLANYLDLRGKIYAFDSFHENVLRELEPEIKQYDRFKSLDRIAHVQLWLITDEYKKWRKQQFDKNDLQRPFTIKLERLNAIKQVIGYYKEGTKNEALMGMIKKGEMPEYDPFFLHTMEKLVNYAQAWQETKKV